MEQIYIKRITTSVVLLGLPQRFSAPHCAAVQRQLERLGLVASRAPNSVWLKRPGANKGVPVRWLAEQSAASAFGFALCDAVALGDNPCGNDGPLASFQERGMPFISVGSAVGWHGFQVGGFEDGSAAVIEQLAIAIEAEGELARRERRPPRRLGALSIDAQELAAQCRIEMERQASRTATPAGRL